MALEGLPVEVIGQILEYLPLYSMYAIRSVCQSLRNASSDKVFLDRYLALQEHYLEFHLTVHTAVTSLTRFEIGLTDSGDFVFHNAKFSSSEVFLFKYDTVGRASCSFSQLKRLPLCTLVQGTSSTGNGYGEQLILASATEIPRDHRESCLLCSKLRLARLGYSIDKGYRVFFQSWKDSLDFVLPTGACLKLQIIHAEENASNWYPSPAPTTDISVFRYGLLQSSDDLARLTGYIKVSGMKLSQK